jgi:hypothetical protein
MIRAKFRSDHENGLEELRFNAPIHLRAKVCEPAERGGKRLAMNRDLA